MPKTPNLLTRGDAAERMGIRETKLERLRLKGVIHEFILVGRYYTLQEDKLDELVARLLKEGHLKPSDIRRYANAG